MLKSYDQLYSNEAWGTQIQIQRLIDGYQDFLIPDIFQSAMSKLVQDMEYIKTIVLI
jgi:hypothetical protein